MDQPTDAQDRQLGLTALTTEVFNLQTARVGTISEANGRATLYLGTLSSAVIALAFVGQGNDLGDGFYAFAFTLLPTVFLLGVFTYARLVQTSLEDVVYTLAQFRIREYFVHLDPAAAPFFPPTDSAGISKLERMGLLPTSRLQRLLTVASMVACINSVVAGAIVALALRALADLPVTGAASAGVLAAIAVAVLFLVHQERRFGRTAAVIPELFRWESSGMPRWVQR